MWKMVLFVHSDGVGGWFPRALDSILGMLTK